MFNETRKLSLVSNDDYITGTIYDKVTFVEDGTFKAPNGEIIRGKKGDTYNLPAIHNLILNSFPLIVARLIKGDTEGFIHNLWWEMGEGEKTWTGDNIPVPNPNVYTLIKPIFRKRVEMSDVHYVNELGEIISEPSNRIEMSVDMLFNEGNGMLREFSIYMGGDGAFGSGLPINRKNHATVEKTRTIELTRKVQFKF